MILEVDTLFFQLKVIKKPDGIHKYINFDKL